MRRRAHSNAPASPPEPEGGNASVVQAGSEHDVGARCPPSSDGGPPFAVNSRIGDDRRCPAWPRADTSERENNGRLKWLSTLSRVALGAFGVNSLARCRTCFRDAATRPGAASHSVASRLVAKLKLFLNSTNRFLFDLSQAAPACFAPGRAPPAGGRRTSRS